MSIRRILRIGNSLGVSLPAREIGDMGLKEGTPVEVNVDKVHRQITIRPVPAAQPVDPAFIQEARKFAERNREILEELAK